MKASLPHFIVFVLFVVLAGTGYSQPCPTTAVNPWEWPSHSNWFVGNGIQGKFLNGGGIQISPQPSLVSYEGITSASDDRGRLVFHTNGRLLWDAAGNLKYSGLLEGNEGHMTNGSAAQGVMSVRHPLDTNSYYVFTVDDANQPTANGLNYFVFDRNANPVSGPVRLGSYRTSEGLTATKHFNGVDIWITVYASGTNDFYTYLLKCDGVVATPVISPVAPKFSGQKERGGLAFSWNGKFFAQGHPDYNPDSDKEVSVYKFDNKTGIISDPHHISSPTANENPYDIIFSPDNSKVYVSSATGNLAYYDISSWNTATMTASYKQIPGVATGSHSAIEIGGDGKLYMATLAQGLGVFNGNLNSGSISYSLVPGTSGTNRGLPTMYLPPAEEPEIAEVGPFCPTDPPVDLSTNWICSGLDAEDVGNGLSVYSGNGITNPVSGIFSPSAAGVGTHMIIYKRCSVDDTTFIIVKACSCPDTSLKPIPPLCADGSLNLNDYKLTTENGTWSIVQAPPGSTATITGGNMFNANNTVAGNYTVRFTLSDQKPGCPPYAERIIRINPLPVLQLTASPINCYGQSTTLTVSGAQNYSWSTGAQGTSLVITPGSTSTYTVTGTDANGCKSTKTITITVPPKIDVNTSAVNITCFGKCDGSVAVTASGGTGTLSFNWSTNPVQNSQQISALCPGTYTVTVTDNNSCVVTASVTITEPPLLSATVNTQQVQCKGMCNGAITALATGGNGGYVYNWSTSPPQQTANISQLCPGTYSLTVQDSKLCVYTTTITITEPDSLKLSVQKVDPTCKPDGKATVTATGGNGTYTYNWNSTPPQTTATATGLPEGIYTVTVIDAKGCKDSASVTLVAPITFTLTTTSTNASCYGICDGTASVSVSGGTGNFTYHWNSSPPQNTAQATQLCAGTYTILVVDIDDCKNKAVVNITQPPQIFIQITHTNPTCLVAGTATAQASGGSGNFTYLWNNGQTQNTATGLSPGTYTVIVTDAISCKETATVTLLPPQYPTAAFSFSNACIGSPVIFNNNCTVGNGNTITHYYWNFGDPQSGINNISNASSGISHLYNSVDSFLVSVLVIADNGCRDSIKKWVPVWPMPIVNFSYAQEGCAPLCANFINSSSISMGSISHWVWNFGDPASGTANFSNAQHPGSHCYVNPGTYDVTLGAESNKGCKTTKTMAELITVYPVPVAAFRASTYETQILDPEINFSDETIGEHNYIHWDFGVSNILNDTANYAHPSWTYQDTGKYMVCLTVENQYGCRDNICRKLEIKPYWTIYVPNTFTPNGDGFNDFFNASGFNILAYQLWIFDRWGNMIYTTGNTSGPEAAVPWNGKANGGTETAQQDVYVWKIKLTDIFYKERNYSGTVNLIK